MWSGPASVFVWIISNNVSVTLGNQELVSFLDIKYIYAGMHANIQGEELMI